MAGDWLKFEANTPEKREVFGIAVAMGWPDPDLAVGKLLKIWRWFDQQTVDGNAPSVTLALLDNVCGVSGFAKAMCDVGWLVQTDDGVSLPNFGWHNGKTAKARCQTAKRVSSHKTNAKGNAKTNAGSVTKALPREEKRREDIKQELTISSCTEPQSDSTPAASGLVDLADMDAMDLGLAGGTMAPSPTPTPAPEHEPTEPPVLMMPLVGNTEFGIMQMSIDEWVAAYPGVDVIRQLAAMRQWCLNNPRKRKTRRGVLGFCNSWLMKEQDKAGARLPSAGTGRPARFDPVAHVNQGGMPQARGGDGIIDINPR
jgi:hypothetical protein